MATLESLTDMLEIDFGKASSIDPRFKWVFSKVQARATVVEQVTVIRMEDGQLLQALSAHTHHDMPVVKFGLDSTCTAARR